ncbi:MAG: hypothetical protein H7844_01410 [Nitrospirae bacterium YQR-1]
MKDLLKDMPRVFLKILTGYDTCKFIDVQFPDIQLREPDLVLEVPDGNLFQVEIQGGNQNNMLERMYLYSGFIFNQHKKLPIQIVLYIGNEPLNMKCHMENKYVKYSYKVIDIKEIDCSQLLAGDDPEDIVLAILCKTNDVDVTIKNILKKLSVLPPKECEGYIRKLLYLSDLRKLYPKVKMEVSKMPITIDVRESDIFLEGLTEGIEGMLEIKFGSKGLELMDMVRIVPTVDKLEEFKNLIKKSGSIEELKEFLGKNI